MSWYTHILIGAQSILSVASLGSFSMKCFHSQSSIIIYEPPPAPTLELSVSNVIHTSFSEINEKQKCITFKAIKFVGSYASEYYFLKLFQVSILRDARER